MLAPSRAAAAWAQSASSSAGIRLGEGAPRANEMSGGSDIGRSVSGTPGGADSRWMQRRARDSASYSKYVSSSEYGGTHEQRRRAPAVPAVSSCHEPGGIRMAAPSATATTSPSTSSAPPPS